MTQTWRRCAKENREDVKPKIRKDVWLEVIFLSDLRLAML